MTITRVRYRERQPLRAVDLTAEQAHRIAMRRRHNIGQHDWGIVAGLALATGPNGLWVQPGMAVDGYGRELIVPEPVSLPTSAFDQLGETLDVWLLYGCVAETPLQRGRFACGLGQHSRWREEARLRLTLADTVDPRRPVEVPEADLDFGPQETPPDDPEREWPVYLGRVKRNTVDLANRPYVTLVGDMITAPSGRARMQVGSELAGDRRRFAVSLPDAAGAFVDWLAIDRDGNATVQGNTTLAEGDLIVAEAAPDPACGVEFRPLAAPPQAAAPWQAYRTVVSQDGTPINQLRLEIGHPGDKGDPTRYRLVIGSVDAAGTFTPCLTVRADCTVIVHGNLVPEGQVIEGPIQADPDDPRFAAALLDRWVRGLAGAGAQVDAFYAGELQVELEVRETVGIDRHLNYTVQVSNPGRGTVTSVKVHETLICSEKLVRQEYIGPEILTLDPKGKPERIDRSYGVADDQDLANKQISLTIIALGVGPAGNTVTTSASKTVQIQQPGPS